LLSLLRRTCGEFHYVKDRIAQQWLSWLLRTFAILLAAWATPSIAATCGQATSQGTSGPAAWQTYCWIDMTSYSDTTARSAGGQNFSITLSDGATLTFNLKVTTTAAAASPALNAVASPSWAGGAFGNSAFVGIPNKPILYTATGGTVSTITISSILITPLPGVPPVSAYSFVIADGESTAAALPSTESIQLTTNGTGWVLLDSVAATSGPNMPTQSGLGTTVVNWTGNSGDPVGGYVIGTNSPTMVSAKMVPIGGLEGVLFAVRFASLRLTKQIGGARVDPTDQFKFDISATSTGAILATGTSSGTGLGPFTAAAVSLASGIPLTIGENMAVGSVSAMSHYSPRLTCTNGATGSSTPVPTNVATTSYSFGTLQFGDAVQCTFTNTAYPHIALAKTIGTGGRRFAGDEFTVNITNGATTLATATTVSPATTATTPPTQVTSGTAYSLSEVAAAGSLAQYTSTMSCTNAATGSTTALPTTVPGTLTPVLGDVVTCTITNTRRAANATLTLVKFSTIISDPINGSTNPKAIPGAIVRYSITVTNTGSLAVDSSTATTSSLIITDPLPTTVTFDASTPVSFTNGTTASGLSAFNAATMVKYSSAAGGGAPFTYTPTAGYDPNVKGLQIVPLGSMAGATSATAQPSFTISFLARIN
jgi:Surface adhesin CshA non-repetitive domain 2